MVQRAPEFYAGITRTLDDKGMNSISATLVSEFGSKMAALASTPTGPDGWMPTQPNANTADR